jgi:hypothetical protein
MPITIGSHRTPPPGWMSATPTPGLKRSQNVEIANHRVVVFSGHGSLNTITDSAHLQFTVPMGTTITFWVNHTEGLDDAIGTRIDSRWSLQDLPKNVGAALETIKGGQLCYNYRLTPPKGLTLGNDPSKDPRFIINPQSVTSTDHISTRGLLFADLIQLPVCRNASVHWAACRSIMVR